MTVRVIVKNLSAGSGRKETKKPKKRASWGPLSRSRSKGKAMQDDQDESFVPNERSRSEDGSPRATLEDEDADTPEQAEGLCLPNHGSRIFQDLQCCPVSMADSVHHCRVCML